MDTLSLAQSTLRLLHISQSLSALTFSSFLVLHLTAPLTASIAPRAKAEQLASGFMVLGRVYYQEKLEMGVVWGSVAVHVVSGLAGRLLKGWERAERRKRRRETIRREMKEIKIEDDEDEEILQKTAAVEGQEAAAIAPLTSSDGDDEDDDEELAPEEPSAPFLPTPRTTISSISTSEVPSTSTSFLGHFSSQHISGLLLLPLLLHHSTVHRILPSSSSAPYNSLSPTLLSYAFVGYALSSTAGYIIQLASASGYAALLSVGSFHALSGLRRILDPTAPSGLRPRSNGKGRGWGIAYSTLMLGVGVGVIRLALEGGTVPGWLGRKYDVVLRKGFAMSPRMELVR